MISFGDRHSSEKKRMFCVVEGLREISLGCDDFPLAKYAVFYTFENSRAIGQVMESRGVKAREVCRRFPYRYIISGFLSLKEGVTKLCAANELKIHFGFVSGARKSLKAIALGKKKWAFN